MKMTANIQTTFKPFVELFEEFQATIERKLNDNEQLQNDIIGTSESPVLRSSVETTDNIGE